MDWTLRKQQPWIRLTAGYLILEGIHDLLMTRWSSVEALLGKLTDPAGPVASKALLAFMFSVISLALLVAGLVVWRFPHRAKTIILATCVIFGVTACLRAEASFTAVMRQASGQGIDLGTLSQLMDHTTEVVVSAVTALLIVCRDLSGRRFAELLGAYLLTKWTWTSLIYVISPLATGVSPFSFGLAQGKEATFAIFVLMAAAIVIGAVAILLDRRRPLRWCIMIALAGCIREVLFYHMLYRGAWKLFRLDPESIRNLADLLITILMYAMLVGFVDRLGSIPADDRRCRECDYDLTGNVSGVCPECGAALVDAPAASSS